MIHMLKSKFILAGLGLLLAARYCASRPSRAPHVSRCSKTCLAALKCQTRSSPTDGKTVGTPEQWKLRREEMKNIMEEYVYGHMPPSPGNVSSHEVRKNLLTDGTVSYRLVHLTFGKDDKLGFDIGIFTPC